MSEKILSLPNGKHILIDRGISEVILQYQQNDKFATEAGGILIGEYRGPHLHVVDLTTPFSDDIRKKYYFHRCSPGHNQYAQKRWIASNQTQAWIGEWHTHPENFPTPSKIDIDNWQKRLPKKEMLLIIQGRIDCWYGFWNSYELSTLILRP
ncbi:Mov34/MPN/PAD-1 family protein [Neisseria sp. Ec49-e6-T10]|uniref:Mov34/MPN/PAD-1 family protein n=1 Tax=Neisseria sp. Ec49-e6-T10 TaxID=3140744 RepID=UPI003EB79B79